VIVEETRVHVVWVDAANLGDAERVARDTWIGDLLREHGGTLASLGYEIRKPAEPFKFMDGTYSTAWDWQTIYDEYGDGDYQAPVPDAHVDAWRDMQFRVMLAHVENENHDEDAGRLAEARRTCRLCEKWREPDHETSTVHVNRVAIAERRKAFEAQRASKAGAR